MKRSSPRTTAFLNRGCSDTTWLTYIDAEANAAARATVPVMAGWLQDILGQKLTAAIVGMRSPKKVGARARGDSIASASAEKCLRNLYRVAWMLSQADGPDTVRGWLVGMNPQLDDLAPAALIAGDPARVLQAARSFLAGG